MVGQLSSVLKTLDILDLFESKRVEFTAQEISHSLNIPLSSTYKYLEILTKKQFLRKLKGNKGYRLGIKIHRLAMYYTPEHNFLETAQRSMKNLCDLSNETVFLSVIKGWEALVIETIEPAKEVKISIEKGSINPLYAGAAQKVLLAYQKNSFIQQLIKRMGLHKMTPNTITDPEKLKEELSVIRKKGYALSDSEVHLWIKALAAPVFDHNGSVIAGLAIATPKGQYNNEEIIELIEILKSKALQISNELGFKKE